MCGLNSKSCVNIAISMMFAMLVSACGGGSGSNSISSSTPPIPTLNTAGFIDPGPPATNNPAVGGLTTPYALGTKDPWYMPGGGFEQANGRASIITPTRLLPQDSAQPFHYQNGINILHRRLRTNTQSVSVHAPPPAVLQAWHDGWTGRGINMLIIDDFGLPSFDSPEKAAKHGYLVTLAARSIAINANYYALEAGLFASKTTYRQEGGFRDMRTGLDASRDTEIKVINISFGIRPQWITPKLINDYLDKESDLFDDLKGTGSYLTNTGDAVIVKAAGNYEGEDTRFEVVNQALIKLDPSVSGTAPRTLLVGGTGKDIAACDPDTCLLSRASISGIAGTDPAIHSRFLVSYAGASHSRDVTLCDRDTATTCEDERTLSSDVSGTSYAAPRVAGYAALVRHKFPNLSGAQTASILLDTATYDGLSGCSGPNTSELTCRNIYGQGRVDIGVALAPIGALQ